MFKSLFAKLTLVLALMIFGGMAWAAVIGSAVSSSPALGSLLQIPLKISSPTGVAGINGEFKYDPTYFSSPSIVAGPGAPGFIVLGNLVSAGRYKFVIYADPTKTMNASQPVAFFQVRVTSKVTKSVLTQITYPTPASSSAAASSMTTSFSSVSVKLQGNGANDWVFYE